MGMRYTIAIEVLGITENGDAEWLDTPTTPLFALDNRELLDDMVDKFIASADRLIKSQPSSSYRWPDTDPYHGQQYGYA